MRHGVPDSGEKTTQGFKLPRTALIEPVIPGVKGWLTPDHWTVIRVHYTADPAVDEEWIKDRAVGYRGGISGRDWQREMEIDFSSFAGEPVYPRFSASEMIRPVPYDPELELWRGWDFGFRHPAVVFMQYDSKTDQLRYLHEVYPTLKSEEVPGINTQSLCAIVSSETRRLFPEVSTGDSPVRDFVDPAGNQHKETSDFSSIEIMQQHGFQPEWQVLGRKNRINYARHWVEEIGNFLINPHCSLAIKAFERAYRFPDAKAGGTDRDMPDLSRRVQSEPYIHIMDAFEYVVANVLQLDDIADSRSWSSNEEQELLVGDLAEMYLRAARTAPADRSDLPSDIDDPSDDYEVRISDLIGEDDLADAWTE